MKKGFLIITLFAILTIAFVYIIPTSSVTSKRFEHESFLLEKGMEFTKSANSEKKGIAPFDSPELAHFHNYLLTIDPQIKRVPVERLQKAHNKTMELKKKKRSGKDIFNIQWEEATSNAGGRTRAVMFDPNDTESKKVWAGAATGGLWYCDDITSASSAWEVKNIESASLSINSLAYDPNNTQIFYAGTGEPQTAVTIYRESSGRGNGILQSIDGGESWSILPSTKDFAYISDIAVRNEDGQSVVYAGVVSGRYKGKDHTSTPSDGLYRSVDNGASWTQVLPNIPDLGNPYAPSDIEIASNGRIFVGTGRNIEGEGGAVIFYSDDGMNWIKNTKWSNQIKNSVVAPIPGRVILASAPSAPDVVYALIASAKLNDGFINPDCYHVIKTINGGESWEKKPIPEYANSDNNWAYIAWHALMARVHPADPNIVFIGGLDVWRSKNGGNDWEQMSSWYNFRNHPSLPNYTHADQHCAKFRPGHPNEMIFSTDGGVFYTSNNKSTKLIIKERNHNFNTLQYYACAIHPKAGINYFLAGAQDNGSFLYDGSGLPVTIFDNVSYGDGGFCFIDEDQPHLQYTSSQNNNFYATPDNPSYSIRDSVLVHYHLRTGIFINPCDYDNKRNVIYSNATTFDGVNPDMITILKKLNVYYSSKVDVDLNKGNKVAFSNIKHSQHEPDGKSVLFAGTMAGRLFKIENIDKTPFVLEIGSNDFPNGAISSIDVGNNNENLIVTFSNYGVISVWETKDGGNNWRDVEGNLPDMPIRWCIFNPQNKTQVLLATEMGVWATDNIDADEVEWSPINNGMPDVRVDMIKVRKSDNTILLATHGRGLFFSNSLNTSISNYDEMKFDFLAYPTPTKNSLTIEIGSKSYKEKTEVSLINIQGKTLENKDVNQAGKTTFDLTGYPEGVYFVRVTNGLKSGVKKIVKQ